MFRLCSIFVVALCAVALMTGCESSHNYSDIRPYMLPDAGPQSIAAAPEDVEAEPDPIKPVDTVDGIAMPADPLIADDPLADDADSLDSAVDRTPPVDPLAQTDVPMPTEHSHWLRGSICDATVTISINHVKLGDFTATIDEDVTMRCRKGYNTVTFTYAPSNRSSFADIDVLESEHNPPIAPLATFDSSVDAVPSAGDVDDVALKPVTKSFEFLAR